MQVNVIYTKYSMHTIHFPFSKITIIGGIVALGLLLGIGAVALFHIRSENSGALSVAEESEQANALQPGAAAPAAVAVDQTLHHYIEITDGCAWDYSGTCVNMRSGAGTEFPVLLRLRTGIVLEVESATVEASDGSEWYKIIPDKNILYPDRMPGPWYVAVDASSVRPFDDPGEIDLASDSPATQKHIVVNLGNETLTAYNADGSVFMQAPISSGLDDTPTPLGTFTIFKKTPSRYMEGPTPGVSEQAYDLPGVPWDLYFTAGGAAIHGAYWHDDFGQLHSHGCVNLPLENAKTLYPWADIGTTVTVVSS